MQQVDDLLKALLLSAFFVFAGISELSADCKPHHLAEPARVKWVYDGDTFLLDDERKVRIIGMDTPEMPNNKQVGEAFSGEATEALRELLSQHDNHVLLQKDEDTYDRYGRVLAHVFLPDGTNTSQWMLKRGFASLLVLPPNVAFTECYHKAEQHAQNRRLNLWSLSEHQLQIADLLSNEHSGYTRLVGRADNVRHLKHHIVITLRGGIEIRIKRSNIKYFKDINFDALKGKRISATGILKKRRNKRSINIHHPVYFSGNI